MHSGSIIIREIIIKSLHEVSWRLNLCGGSNYAKETEKSVWVQRLPGTYGKPLLRETWQSGNQALQQVPA